jgi:uncharacterized protein YggE
MDTITLTMRLPGARARWTLVGLAAGLLVAATVAGPLLAPRPALAVDPTATPAEHTITVTGTGTETVSPDIADVRLGVLVSRPTVKDARAIAATRMNRVIDALKKLGIADKDIQTTMISLEPNYANSNGENPPRIIGYSLSNGVAITVRNLDLAGDVIDDSLAAGATTLDGIAFRVADPAAAQAQARTDAMTQARASADTLAKAAGVSISGVSSISEVSTPVPPIYYGGARLAAMAADAATPVQAGTTDVSITVTVVYQIG